MGLVRRHAAGSRDPGRSHRRRRLVPDRSGSSDRRCLVADRRAGLHRPAHALRRGDLKPATRLNLNYLTQGVTTVVTGNCGSGPIDVAKYLAAVDAHGAGTNVIHLIPHGACATPSWERRSRADRARAGANENAGPARDDGRGVGDGHRAHLRAGLLRQHRRADRAGESRCRLGGIYASHIRNEEEGLLEAIDEAIAIGKSAGVPVHISHLKANGKANWGKAAAALERIAAARSAGQHRHGRSVPLHRLEHEARRDGGSALGDPRRWRRVRPAGRDPDRGPLLRTEIQRELDRRDGGAAIRIARYAPQPELGGSRPGRHRAARRAPLRWRSCSTSSATAAPGHQLRHERERCAGHHAARLRRHGVRRIEPRARPRRPASSPAYGTFPRKIRYALDEHVLSLEQAVRSCTDLPARILGLAERGVLRPGAFADLVVFNPATFRDAATFEDPTRYAPGVSYLFVNGVALIAEGKPTVKASAKAKLPGRALRLQAEGPADLIVLAGRVWTGDPANPWAEARGRTRRRDREGRQPGRRAALQGTADRRDRPPRGVRDARPDRRSRPYRVARGQPRAGRSARSELARRGCPARQGADRLRSRRLLDHRGETGTRASGQAVPFPLPPCSMQSLPAGRSGSAGSTGTPDGPIPRPCAGPASTRQTEGSRRRPDPPRLRAVSPPASSWTGRWDWWPGRSACQPDDLKRRILAAQQQILAAGLTGVHDAGISPAEAEVYRELDHSGQLRLRVYAMASPPAGREVEFVSRPPARPRPASRFELQGHQALHRRRHGIAGRFAVRAVS